MATQTPSSEATTPNKAASIVPTPHKSIHILGCWVDRVTRAQALEQIRYFLSTGLPHQIITANPIMLMAAEEDRKLVRVFQEAGLVVPESSGVAWAAAQLGTPLDEFIPGIDLFQDMCRLARDANQSVFLLGSKPGVADQAAIALCTRIPGLRIAGTDHGYFSSREEEVAVVAKIHELAPGFLFVGMSVPGQEKWIHRHLQALGVPVVMGVGGSFDVLSGRLRRAPVWMQRLGLEWVFRTLQEPWRIKRVMHLPVFVWKILTAK